MLRLRTAPASQNTAFVAADAFDRLPRFLRHLERGLGGTLSAYEVMWADYYQLVTSAPATHRAVLPPDYPYYVLVEALGGDQDDDAERFVRVLSDADLAAIPLGTALPSRADGTLLTQKFTAPPPGACRAREPPPRSWRKATRRAPD